MARFPHRRVTMAGWINRYGFQRVAELGVRDGRTFLHLLEHCPRLSLLVGVDIWCPHPESRNAPGAESYDDWPHDENETRVRAAVEAHDRGDTVRLHRELTREAAARYPDGHFDLVFIDADHTTEGVLADIHDWMPKIRPGGLLVGDDIHWPSVEDAVRQVFGVDYETAPDINQPRKLWFRWL